MNVREEWMAGLPIEIGFWRQIIDGSHPRSEWVDELRMRCAGQLPFPDNFVSRVAEIDPAKLKLLDVGSGPHTSLGPIYRKATLDITAVDPLADAYNRLLDECAVVRAIPTIACEGERLVEMFGRDRFHFVYSRNALDHTSDPAIVIQEMIEVCKPGGVVVFQGAVNEAVTEGYHGLHQWNFMPVLDDLVIWRPGQAFSLKERVHGATLIRSIGTHGYWCELQKSF